MQVTRLQIGNLRRLASVHLQPGPGLNLITGPNGAGKTSLLEALHLMAYGRSFRGRVRDGLVRTGGEAVDVFVEWTEQGGARTRKAGLKHSGQQWQGRLDGVAVSQLSELCAALAVVTFEPGSHALVVGGGESRRRFLDWGLFHVEQGFLPLWRRYARALKQRNAVLKARTHDPQLDAWEQEMAVAGEALTAIRQRYLEELQPQLSEVVQELAPTLGTATLAFQPGWRREELSLVDALLLARSRDLAAGFSSIGPHRADWRIDYSSLPARETLSRGQAKLTALAALLAQAGHYVQTHGEWPVMALDDLASELDRPHQQRVLQRLLDSGAQVFVTGTESPIPLSVPSAEITTFHVEQGLVTAVAPP